MTSVEFEETWDSDKLTVLNSSGRVTLPDIAKLGLEQLAAANNDGTAKVFTQAEIEEMEIPGSNPTLTIWLNDEGYDTSNNYVVEPYYPTCGTRYPACGTRDVFHAIGAGGQILTIVPSQQLVIAKTASLGNAPFSDMKPFWDALFTRESCTCHSEALR